MQIRDLAIDGPKLIELKIHGDERGWFCETYKDADWINLLRGSRFIQDNMSFSAAPFTLRGIHFQRSPSAQKKLIQVIQGEVLDIAVDLRRRSQTFGRWVGVKLLGGDGKQFFIPEGFGHAFVTLAPDTLVQYKVTAPYDPKAEGGVMWNDPEIAIEWPEAVKSPILSERDRAWPSLSSVGDIF